MTDRADAGLQIVASALSMGTRTAVPEVEIDLYMYWIGVPMPIVLASFAGSCCALSFLGSIGRFRAMTIVACSTVIGSYLQPLVGVVTGLPPIVYLGLAFSTGLLAHVIGTTLFASAPDALKEAFSALIERIRGRS